MGNSKTRAAADVAPEATLTPTVEASAAASGGSSYDGLFSGPADLAIQRKIERMD